MSATGLSPRWSLSWVLLLPSKLLSWKSGAGSPTPIRSAVRSPGPRSLFARERLLGRCASANVTHNKQTTLSAKSNVADRVCEMVNFIVRLAL